MAYSFFNDRCLSEIGLNRQKATWLNYQKSTTNSAMIMDMGNYLPGDILTKTDRASMKYGLELRAPFLNKYIIDFSLHLPASFKITTDTDKKILRKTFSSLWPEKIQGRSKQGFGSPVSKWLQASSMQNLKHEAFAENSKIYGHLDKFFVSQHMYSGDMKR
ncbi:hypothetical protein KA005_21870 [bacterium]|nr:hypothetical protein [bacterium]